MAGNGEAAARAVFGISIASVVTMTWTPASPPSMAMAV